MRKFAHRIKPKTLNEDNLEIFLKIIINIKYQTPEKYSIKYILNNITEEDKKILKEIKDIYQKIYGPLTINYPCNKWRWLEEPWPWEGGNR